MAHLVWIIVNSLIVSEMHRTIYLSLMLLFCYVCLYFVLCTVVCFLSVSLLLQFRQQTTITLCSIMNILFVSHKLIAKKIRVGEQSQDVGRENGNTMEDRLSAKDIYFDYLKVLISL